MKERKNEGRNEGIRKGKKLTLTNGHKVTFEGDRYVYLDCGDGDMKTETHQTVCINYMFFFLYTNISQR